ncbi:MAG: DNA repair protein RecO [Bacteroidales bacterium]|jgi:DNA repair protein RecO (recombination protein O)|nr:DNA repair protein RecO [Bacteroidales bacterium]
MIEKTGGIVINYTRYSDHSGIVTLFTGRFGRKAYMARGIGRGKKGMPAVMFQPLMILDIEAYHNPAREVNNLKGCSLSFIPSTIPFSIQKSTISMFLAEILNASIREEQADEELYRFIEKSVIALDECEKGTADFHLLFLVLLSRHLGFGPSSPASEFPAIFDLKNGIFAMVPPSSGLYMNTGEAKILSLMLETPMTDAARLNLTSMERGKMLEQLLKYYSLHLPGFTNLKSLGVLRELFS